MTNYLFPFYVYILYRDAVYGYMFVFVHVKLE
jgi:hypothetical protein